LGWRILFHVEELNVLVLLLGGLLVAESEARKIGLVWVETLRVLLRFIPLSHFPELGLLIELQ